MSNNDSTVHIQYVAQTHTDLIPLHVCAKTYSANQPDGQPVDAASAAVQANPGLQKLDPATASSLEAPLCTLHS